MAKKTKTTSATQASAATKTSAKTTAEGPSAKAARTFPVMTAEQRSAALSKAAAARTARKGLLDQVKAGKLSLAEVLGKSDTDELVKKTKILAVIKALPGVGTVRAAQLLEQVRIVDTRRVGGLGARQREALIAATG